MGRAQHRRADRVAGGAGGQQADVEAGVGGDGEHWFLSYSSLSHIPDLPLLVSENEVTDTIAQSWRIVINIKIE
jgi:hypothetical protein